METEISPEQTDADSAAEGQGVPAEVSPEGNETVEISASELEKMKGMIEQQETFIKQRNTEVGTSRKEVERLQEEVARLAAAKNQLKEDGMPDAFQVVETSNALLEAESALARENARIIEANNKVVFSRVDPAYEKRVDKMAEIMLRGGEDPVAVQQFKSNPYGVDQGIALAYLEAAKREQELEEAKEKLQKLDPQNIAANIQAAARNGSVTAATGGGSSGNVEVTSEMIRSATPTQRKHFIKTGEWISPQ
jgi:DNA repair exonuclease SbcCD ATPase subunit